MFFWEILHPNMVWILLSIGWLMLLQQSVKCRIPPQLLYMILGILIVSFWFDVPEKEMQIMSGFAIIFMLFTSELTGHNIPHFFKSIYKNIRVAIIAAIWPWVWAFAFSQLWGWNFSESIVLWAVFTATALPFTIWVLRELKILNSPAAKVAISASTADDILATLIWIFTSILLWIWASWWTQIHISEAVHEIWLVLLFFAFIYLLHFVFSKFHIFKKYHWWTLTIMIVGWVIIAIWENVFNIHYAIAALFAWVLLNPEFFDDKLSKFTKSSEKLSRATEYVMPFFFIYLGLKLNMVSIFNNITILVSWIGLFLFVAVLQFITAYFSWRWRWLNKANAMTLGFAMTPRDVVAIVILDMNLAFISNENIFPSVILAIFLLNIMAVLWLKYSSKKVLESK